MKLWKRLLAAGLICCTAAVSTISAAEVIGTDRQEQNQTVSETETAGQNEDELVIELPEEEQTVQIDDMEIINESGLIEEIGAEDEEQPLVVKKSTEKMVTLSKLASANKTLRVLAIGNSFTDDTMSYVYEIAKSAGCKLTIGVMWLSSMDLEDYADFMANNRPEMNYDKITSKGRTEKEDMRAKTILADEEWDLVFLQQQSHKNGVPASFYDEDGSSYLETITQYVRRHTTNENLSMGWLMCWAFSKKYQSEAYDLYFNGSQKKMFNELVKTLRSTIWTSGLFDFIVPAGTAIQNVRTSYVGDTLNRDGRHLSLGLGRYAASLTVAESIGVDLSRVTYFPRKEEAVSALHMPMLKQAVRAAVKNPYQVKTSTYTKKPSVPKPAVSKRSNAAGGVKVTWNSTRGATAYHVFRVEKGAQEWQKLGVVKAKEYGADSYSYTDKTAKNGKQYRYCLLAEYDRYFGEKSSDACSSITYAVVPKDVKVTSPKKKQLKVSWTENKLAGEYQVRWSQSETMKDAKTRSCEKGTNSAVLSGLTSGAKYYVQVRCKVGSGTSAWSTAAAKKVN